MNRSRPSYATSLLLAGTLGLTTTLATSLVTPVLADGHETVEALKKQLAGAEKKMAAVTKDRDALYSQLLNSIEEIEALEGNPQVAKLQTKLDQVTAGRDHLAEKLEATIASSKSTEANLQAELESSTQGRDYISDRLEVLHAQAKSNSSNHQAEMEEAQAETNSVADAAFQQIKSAMAERDAAKAELAVANQSNAKLNQDIESIINGRSFIEKQLQAAKSSAAAETAELQAKLDAADAANAKLQQDIESIINGRTYIEGQLTKAKSEAAANEAKLQADLSTATTGRDHLADRADTLLAEAKAKSAQQMTTIAALQAEIQQLKNPTPTASWADSISTNMLDNLAGINGIEVTTVDDTHVNVRIGNVGLFETASTRLSAAGRGVLDQIGFALLSSENMHVLVTGHTDNIPVGDNSRYADNADLSNRRALQAMNHLGDYGVPYDNMSSSGLGDTAPIATNATAEGRGMNRRVELVLSPL